MRIQNLQFTGLFIFLFAFASFAHAQSPASEMQGIVKSHKGKNLELTVVKGSFPPANTVCEMSKQFEEKLGKMTMSGWLGVAKIKVISSDEKNLKLEIIEEKSEITVNDEKVNHFKLGKMMKLEWGSQESEEGQE